MTAPLASLDLVKAHLKVEAADEDVQITAYLDAASGDIRTHYTWPGSDVPPAVVAATLLKVSALYDAEGGAKAEVAAERLLWPYRRWTVDPVEGEG